MHTHAVVIFYIVAILALASGVLAGQHSSPRDQQILKDAVLARQLSDNTFGNVAQTRNAVTALTLMKTAVPQKAAVLKSLQEGLSQAEDIETLYHAASGIRDLAGKVTLSTANKELINAALSSGVLVEMFHATKSIIAAGAAKSFDLSAVIEDVIDLQENDGTYRYSKSVDSSSLGHTGLALQIIADVARSSASLKEANKANIQKAVEFTKNIFTLGRKVEGVVDFSYKSDMKPVTVSSHLIKGLNGLAATSGAKVVTSENFALLINHVLANRFTTCLCAARCVMQGLTIAASNDVHMPVYLDVTDASPASFKVQVTDALGGVPSTAMSVSIVSVKGTGSNTKTALTTSSLKLVPGSKVEYTLSAQAKTSLAGSPAGIYDVELFATPAKPNKAFSKSKFSSQLKITTAVSLTEFSIYSSTTARYNKKADKETVAFPRQLSKVTTFDRQNFIHLSFSLSSTTFSPSQVFVALEKDGQTKIFQDATASKGVYVLSLQVSSDVFLQDVFGPGVYDVRIIVGDALLEKSSNWSVGQIELDIPALEETADSEYYARPEIHHIFRTPDSRPMVIISLIFTVIVLLPAVALLKGLGGLGLELDLPTDPSDILSNVIFQASVAVILVLYTMYFFFLNIFQTFTGLAILLPITTIVGTRALRGLNQRGQAKTTKQE